MVPESYFSRNTVGDNFTVRGRNSSENGQLVIACHLSAMDSDFQSVVFHGIALKQQV